VFFQDEARFGRINDPKYCWAPQPVRPIVHKQMIREYTYAYGAICPFDGESCYLILPSMDAACMNVFLKEISKRFKDNFILIIVDGAPCHNQGILDISDHMMIEYLPPYSPQLNPVENNWEDMREKFFRNLVFESLDTLEDQLVEACLYYENNPDTIRSISAWNWIVDSD
jgi:transposase